MREKIKVNFFLCALQQKKGTNDPFGKIYSAKEVDGK